MAPKILVLNGPNLNILGAREPDVYGHETMAEIEAACAKRASALGLTVEFRQSNSEGELVDWIQGARNGYAGLIVNAGAYTHTSIALLDALLACDVPVIEVHLSNILQRDDFRHHSYVSKAARGLICGFGGFGYEMALEAAARMLGTTREA
jgi:3-dehydroquinate dehydratase-2